MLKHRLLNAARRLVYLRSVVHDADGRARPAPSFKDLAPDDRDPVRRAYRQRCSAVGARWLRPLDAWMLLTAALLAPAIVYVWLVHSRLVAGMLALALLALLDYAARRALPWPDLMTLRDVLLAHRVCPHCAYPLGDATNDDAQLVTCPECAARWNVDHPLKT